MASMSWPSSGLPPDHISELTLGLPGGALDWLIEVPQLCTMQADWVAPAVHEPDHNRPEWVQGLGSVLRDRVQIAPELLNVGPEAIDDGVDAPGHAGELLTDAVVRGSGDCPRQVDGHGVQRLDRSVV